MFLETLQKKINDLLDPSDDQSLISSAANVVIISMVIATIIVFALETDEKLVNEHSDLFRMFEFAAAVFFTTEYLLRLWWATAGDKYASQWRYVLCPDSIVDLLALVPLLLSFLTEDVELIYFLFLRLFQLLKLFRYFAPLSIMATVFKAELRAFMSAMLVMVVLMFISATGIYFFENESQPQALASIPQSMWWGIVTLTTLGYGNIVSVTTGGKVFAGMMTLFAVVGVSLPAGMLASRFSEELLNIKQSFDMLMEEMLEDGKLDEDEEEALEKLLQTLCLSVSDVKALKLQRQERLKKETRNKKQKTPILQMRTCIWLTVFRGKNKKATRIK